MMSIMKFAKIKKWIIKDGSTGVLCLILVFIESKRKRFFHFKLNNSIKNIYIYSSVLMTFVNQFNEKTDMLVQKLRGIADGKTIIKLFHELNLVTLDAIAQVNIKFCA